MHIGTHGDYGSMQKIQKVKARQNPSMEGEGGHEVLLLAARFALMVWPSEGQLCSSGWPDSRKTT